MIYPDEAKLRISRHYERWYRTWAADIFYDRAEIDTHDEDSVSKANNSHSCSVALKPPTEKEALEDVSAVRKWVSSWRNDPLTTSVHWGERDWKSIGKQEIPLRLFLPDITTIAQSASQAEDWEQLAARTTVLAERWSDSWRHSKAASTPPDSIAIRQAIKKCASRYQVLSEDDWMRLLATLDWLMDNPEISLFVRQLPIRGIDSKWLETHKSALEPFYAAMTGSTGFAFKQRGKQIQVRFLDETIAPGGLHTFAATPEELNTLTARPHLTLVVENLTTLYCLPDLPHTVAFHGGGYAVDALSGIAWLLSIPILYWGDLDSNGFAILDRLRHHHPHVVSLMMDPETLRLHEELCVVEASPHRGRLECLTSAEQGALDMLLSGEEALRIEQERIAWDYALACIERAVEEFEDTKARMHATPIS